VLRCLRAERVVSGEELRPDEQTDLSLFGDKNELTGMAIGLSG